MRLKIITGWLVVFATLVLAVANFTATAGDKDFPAKPNPPRLVNDFAGMMSTYEQSQLEEKLLSYEKTSSTQITVVTVKSLGSYEIADYAVQLGRKWGIGKKEKNNGVLVLASLNDRAVNISVGYGLEGALTDATSGQIIRREIVPEFKQARYYKGFDRAADAIIAATKGEYGADEKDTIEGKRMPAAAIIIIILVVYFVLWILGKIGGGGGSYMSGRGHRNRGWGSPWIGGGGFGGFGGGGWGGSGGGGFGGFGGGSFGGGGASGRW